MLLKRLFLLHLQLALLMMGFLLLSQAWAQTQKTSPHSSKEISSSNSEAKPIWSELTEAQRKALAPLHVEWQRINASGKQKWVEIANRFPAMNAQEQERAQTRMKEWISLSPEQRRQIRENYKAAKAIPKEQREAQWQEYQSLPEERKKALEAKARNAQSRKPAGALPQAKAAKTTKPEPSVDSSSSKTPPPVPAAPSEPATAKSLVPTP